MQTVLSIDASTSPAEALVVGIDGRHLSVLEQHFCPAENIEAFIENLKELIASVKIACTNSILFLPGDNHLSLNLSLPFSEGKQLSKIIDLEVQDVIPFELTDFLLHHRHIRSHGQGEEDVHVGLFPKSTLSLVLKHSKEADFEPLIISTPGSALQGLYELHGENLAPNAAVVLEHSEITYLGIIIDKKLVLDRSLPRASYSSAASHMNADIELAIRAGEERYLCSLSMVYYISNDVNSNFLAAAGREVKKLSIMTLFPSISRKVSAVALLGSLFVQDYPAPKILSNFRSRNFAYTPRISELFKASRALIPYLLIVLLIITIGLLTTYFIRERRIEALRASLRNEISKEFPDFVTGDGSESEVLQKQSAGLEVLLKDLGSPLASSPLNILAQLSEDLSSVPSITTQRITIKNGEVRVEGTGPNYKAIEDLEKTLKRRKAVFCKVKNDSPASGSRDNARDYIISLGICE